MEPRHTRQGYADALVELGREDPRVVVLDSDGSVLHSQLVPEIADEPDYDAALAALG